MMSPSGIGALVGIAVALADFVWMGWIAARPGISEQGGRALKRARLLGFLVFPIVGWFVGPELIGGQ